MLSIFTRIECDIASVPPPVITTLLPLMENILSAVRSAMITAVVDGIGSFRAYVIFHDLGDISPG